MNSVPTVTQNSALSPKLGWVHQVHTLNPGCAQRPRALRPGRLCRGPVPDRIVACDRPCRKPSRPCRRPGPCLACTARHIVGLPDRVAHCIATQSCVAASLSLPPVRTQTLYRNTGPCSAPCRALAVRVEALLRRVAGRWALYRSHGCTVSRHKVAPLSATIQLLYRDPAPNREHYAPCRACARPYRGPTTSCRGPCLGRIADRLGHVVYESWPVHAHPCAASLPSLSQYSLLYCDSN